MSTTFSPSPAELALVSQIFAQSDPQKLGIITGEVAVRVFGGAKLSPTVLGEIWSIADEDNKGWLPKKGVAIAVRLMGWAQKGEKITSALVNKPGPLPTIEGISAVTQQNTGMSMPKSPPPGLPPLTPQDKVKYQNMFMKAGPINGLLSGDRARDIFVKSKLSNDHLLQIWNLADTQDRGALDSTDFTIGMYFIHALMTSQLSFVPSSLPPGLYQQAGGKPAGSVRSHTTGNSAGSLSPISSLQYSSQSQMQQADHTGYNPQNKPAAPRLPVRPSPAAFGSGAFGSGAFGNPSGSLATQRWDVTPVEKANADRYFDGLDPQKRGFIEGDVAVPFMLESKLPGDDLAQVWDLADLNGDGRLTRDGFAVAMYLIQKKLGGVDIPSALPPSLVPPSMRTNDVSPFSPALSHTQPEPAKDLFSWDDTPPPSATLPKPVAGGPSSAFQLQQTGQRLPASTAQVAPRGLTNDPFGSSLFPAPVSHRDLLGDDEDTATTSPPLHDQSAEIGNVQIQLNSTNRSLEAAKTERATSEQTLANQAAQLSTLQTQLSSAKAAYEAETKLLSTLRERHALQNADIQKAREELIRAESDLSAVRVEKAEVEGSFLRDKEDARDLHRKMVEAGQHVETLKSEVEKVKKEAKQQKGLLAIAKKQLSTKETEKAKVELELEEANKELAEVNKEREDVEAKLSNGSATAIPAASEGDPLSDSVTFAASHALSASPDPTTPAGGSITGKSNNPFERLMSSGNSSPRPQSPFLPLASSPAVIGNGLPKETVPAEDSKEDPFGFSQPFESGEHLDLPPSLPAVSAGEMDIPTPTPSASTVTPTPVPVSEPPVSPTTASESEHFITPPTTAISTPSPQNPVAAAASQFSALDDSPYRLPPAETTTPGHFPGQPPETDLAAPLKELEVEESDSEDDNNVPLALLAKGKTGVEKIESAVSAPATNGTVESKGVSSPTFDDVFDVSPPTVLASSPPSQPPAVNESKDAFGVPIVNAGDGFGPVIESPKEQVAPPEVAGVNAFDEALGKFPSTTTSAAPQFTTFESAFEDNFDFASASATPFPPAPTAVNGHAASDAPPAAKNNNIGIDGFTAVPAIAPPASPLREAQKPDLVTDPLSIATTQSPTSQKPAGISFEEAFSGFESGPSLTLDNSFSPSSSTFQPAPADSPTPKAFPSVSTPTSPKTGPSSPSAAAPVPTSPREASPPRRVSSPKPRSASSPKETHEKKEPHTRHSKLSIRLPFGKKRKQESIPPPPARSQHLPTTSEEPNSATADGDVDAVKQLTAMGFSRNQVVSALEKHGYDVPKALNSLLGAP